MTAGVKLMLRLVCLGAVACLMACEDTERVGTLEVRNGLATEMQVEYPAPSYTLGGLAGSYSSNVTIKPGKEKTLSVAFDDSRHATLTVKSNSKTKDYVVTPGDSALEITPDNFE